MIPAILFFLVLLAPPLFLAAVREKRFEDSAALTTGAMILLIFACGMIGLLKFTVYLILGGTAALLLLSVFLTLRRKQLRRTLAAFFTPGFLAFTLVYVFLLYAHYNRVLHVYDEFTHWGDVVKAMSQTDVFSTSPQAHSYFSNYVPGMALFQYLFEKIAMVIPGGIFTDWRMYFAYHLLVFIFLLPFLTVRNWKWFVPAFLLIVFTAISPSFLFTEGEFLSSIYVDGFLGLLAGAGFAMLFLKKPCRTKTAHLLVICALLVLVKDVGMLFAAVLGIAYFLSEIPRYRKDRKKLLIPAGLTALAVGLPKILWEISIRTGRATLQKFRRPIRLDVLWRVITGQETETYAAKIPGAVFSRLLGEPVGLRGAIGVRVIYPVLAALLCGLLALAWHLWNKKEPEAKIQHRAAAWGVILTLVLYCLGMPLLYMFKLNSDTLASFDRYMSIVFGCFAAAVFLLFAVWMQEKPKRMAAGIGVCLVIGLLTINPTLALTYLNREGVADQHYVQGRYDDLVQAMQELADGEEKHVWIISQQSKGSDFWPIRYGIRPCNGEINVGFSISAITKELYPGDMWTILIGTEEWKEKLKDYDYVLIYRADDSFRESYSTLFANPEDIADETIFAVNHETDLMERVY